MNEDELKNTRWWNDPFVVWMLWIAAAWVLLIWAATIVLSEVF